MMKYYFFLDETGDHGLNFVDKNFPIFLLCGCLFREDHLLKIEGRINSFKKKYFQTENIILHSRDIRKCEGVFQILFDLNLKASFYNDLNPILEEGEYTLIGAIVNKEEHIKKYGKGARDPYALSLSFIMERLVFFIQKVDRGANVEIIVEERGKNEDRMLQAHFNSILDRGTYYVQSKEFKNLVGKFRFHSKRDNILGLQVADLCAYPMARHMLDPEVPYIPFKIIEDKIYSNEKGRYLGWGLKTFP